MNNKEKFFLVKQGLNKSMLYPMLGTMLGGTAGSFAGTALGGQSGMIAGTGLGGTLGYMGGLLAYNLPRRLKKQKQKLEKKKRGEKLTEQDLANLEYHNSAEAKESIG